MQADCKTAIVSAVESVILQCHLKDVCPMKKTTLFIFAFLLLGSSIVLSAEVAGRDTVATAIVRFEISESSPSTSDAGYKKLLDEVIPYINSHSKEISKVVVRGHSSPDGDYRANLALTNERANKVLGILQNHIDTVPIELNNTPFNYEYLLDLMGEGHPDYEKLSEIVKSCGGNEALVQKQLKNGSGRNIWNRLKKDYFPDMRYVEVSCYLDKEPVSDSVKTDTVFVEKPVTDTVFITRTVTDTVAVAGPSVSRKPLLAVKTNLLADIFPYSPFGVSFIPNIHFELFTYLWNTSVEFEFDTPWWSNDATKKYFQIQNGTLGVRKYLGEQEYSGWFAGLYGQTAIFDLCKDASNGWQGEVWGVGLTGGYAWRLKREPRLRFEAFIRAGYLNAAYDPYVAGSDTGDSKYYFNYYMSAPDFRPRQSRFHYWGPTMVGINISFDLITK